MDDRNSNAGVQYLPTKCPFYQRIGHKAVRMNEEVLIFGGTSLSGEFLKTILRFNLQNFKIQPLSNTLCPNLEGYSLFTHKGSIYLWGGCLQNKFCNTLLSFRGTNFESCIQRGDIPPPRAFHCSSFIANKYLLIYGGFNETEIFNDWYIFNLETQTWNKVQANRQLPKNVKFDLAWGNGNGYLVSQYSISKTDHKVAKNVKNQVFQVRVISFSSFKIRIDVLQYIQGQIMLPRSNFSLTFIDKQLWLIGGQTFNQSRQNQIILSNQVWALNIQTLSWIKKSFSLNSKSNFELIGFKNKLYLFGGLRSNNEMSSFIEVLTTKNQNLYQTQMCNFCKSVFSVDSNPNFHKQNTAFQIQIKDQNQILTQISTNFISKLARSLQNPIQAVGLLIDNSLNMGASSISILINTPYLSNNYFKQNNSYLYIGDNSKSFAEQQIARIMFSFRFKVQKYYRDHIDKEDIKMRNQYGLHLKLASLRLGASCLFVTNTVQGSIFVSYFSDCQTDCPDGDPSFNCFFYIINKDGICSSKLNRQIIKQNVKHLLSEDDFLNVKTHSTKVYVFDLFDINKIQATNNKLDISYSFPIGIALASLSQYVSFLYLNPFLGRQIFIEQNRIPFINLIAKFKQDQKNGWLQQIDTSLKKGVFARLNLYKIMKSSYSFQYVYVYHQNRLISAIASKQKTICGFIEIPEKIQIDFFKSKIEKWQQQRKLIGYIESKQQLKKRLRKNQGLEEQQLRKIKPNYFQF